jgi:hypothetical protein
MREFGQSLFRIRREQQDEEQRKTGRLSVSLTAACSDKTTSGSGGRRVSTMSKKVK